MSEKQVMQRIQAFFKAYWLAFVIFTICGVLQLFGWADILKYDRNTVFDGEPWRFITGNFVHLGWAHFWMNMGALGLIWLMFAKRLSTPEWFIVLSVCALTVSTGVHIHNTEFIYYVGLSGILHGLVMAGVIRELKFDRFFALTVGGLTTAKLAYEQFNGALPGSESTAGGTVLVDSHLFGAIGGVLAMLIVWLIQKTK